MKINGAFCIRWILDSATLSNQTFDYLFFLIYENIIRHCEYPFASVKKTKEALSRKRGQRVDPRRAGFILLIVATVTYGILSEQNATSMRTKWHYWTQL